MSIHQYPFSNLTRTKVNFTSLSPLIINTLPPFIFYNSLQKNSKFYMSKSIFFFCLLAFACCFLAEASDSKNFRVLSGAKGYCNFTVVSNEDIVITPDGAISAIHAISDYVNQRRKTASKASLVADDLDNDIQYVEYAGTNCNVKLQFWSNKNFVGNWTRYTISNRKQGTITLSNYMSHNVSSYKFFYY